jgi:O-acetylhomoserine/O-acetylserine sulfhydrylase-like pyridoxal-dependent enzyme
LETQYIIIILLHDKLIPILYLFATENMASLTSFATNSIHAGQPPDPITGGVCVPINLSTTFAQDNIGVPSGSNHPAGYEKGFCYARG